MLPCQVGCSLSLCLCWATNLLAKLDAPFHSACAGRPIYLPSWMLPFTLPVLGDQSTAWLKPTAVRQSASATRRASPVGVRLLIVTDGSLTIPHALQVLGIGKVGGLQVDAVVLAGSLQRLVPLPT